MSFETLRLEDWQIFSDVSKDGNALTRIAVARLINLVCLTVIKNSSKCRYLTVDISWLARTSSTTTVKSLYLVFPKTLLTASLSIESGTQFLFFLKNDFLSQFNPCRNSLNGMLHYYSVVPMRHVIISLKFSA